MDDDGADVKLLVAERLRGGADVVLAQTDLQNVADRPDEGKAETGTHTSSWKSLTKENDLNAIFSFDDSCPQRV